MAIIMTFITLWVFYMFPKVRCFAFNLFTALYYLPIDIYYYFKHKKYNECKVGIIVAIIGLFGKGKTLTAVHIIASKYHNKNGKMIYCKRRKKMVKQRIKIISNVHLLVPYEKFVSLEQIVLSAQNNEIYDDLNDTLTITLCLGDEFSVQMNSRSFKSNIDPLLLNTILTCRHYYIAVYYTTQRFGLVDALLRQVTSYCIDCNKSWRLQGIDFYDAWQLENASSPLLVKPYRRDCWFVTNKDYEMYNTLACVENLKKSMSEGDMMSQEEILALQVGVPTGAEQILTPSRRFSKLLKK